MMTASSSVIHVDIMKRAKERRERHMLNIEMMP